MWEREWSAAASVSVTNYRGPFLDEPLVLRIVLPTKPVLRFLTGRPLKAGTATADGAATADNAGDEGFGGGGGGGGEGAGGGGSGRAPTTFFVDWAAPSPAPSPAPSRSPSERSGNSSSAWPEEQWPEEQWPEEQWPEPAAGEREPAAGASWAVRARARAC